MNIFESMFGFKKNDKNTKKLYKCHSTDAIFECSHNALRCDAHIYLHNQF